MDLHAMFMHAAGPSRHRAFLLRNSCHNLTYFTRTTYNPQTTTHFALLQLALAAVATLRCTDLAIR